MSKIAVCLSGDNLTWNTSSKNQLYDFLNLFPEHQIDFYGHCWDNYDIPNDDVFKFKSLIVESKTIIDDWVREDFITRAFHDPREMKPKVKNDDAGYIRFISDAISLTTKNYSQPISALTCFNIPNIDNYDALVSVSWNCTFSNLDNEYVRKQVISVFNRAIEATKEDLTLCFAPCNTRVASKNSGPLHADAIPVAVSPKFLIFTKNAIMAFNKNNAFDRLIGVNRMLPKSSINVKNNVLWGELIKNAKIHIEGSLPEIFDINSIPLKNNDIFF